jgi:H+/gluconate symporter-like permease
MIAAVIGLSILCMIVGFVSQLAHFALPTAVYNFVIVLPLIGLPIGIILIAVLVIMYAIRRSREARSVE